MMRLTAGRFEGAFQLASALVSRGEAPPTVLAISDARRTIRVEAFGSQDGNAIPADVVAPLFSVTKPMVAAAVAQLWERGLLNLHELVASCLPGFEANGKQGVMIRHLLTHTACMNELPGVEAMRRGCGAEELEAAVLAASLDAVPGTRQRYSSAAFIALGMIVRKVSGLPLEQYMQKEVFEPLGMERTGFDQALLTKGLVLKVPNLADLGMSPSMESFIPLRLPAAGLWSCAEDVLRFARAFLRGGRGERGGRGPHGRILAPATCQAILSPQTTRRAVLRARRLRRLGHGAGLVPARTAQSQGHRHGRPTSQRGRWVPDLRLPEMGHRLRRHHGPHPPPHREAPERAVRPPERPADPPRTRRI